MQIEAATEEAADSDTDSTDQSCCVCMAAPKNASVVHGDTAHICCCLDCAKTLHSKGNACPICNEPIDTVLRNFVV